MPYEEMKRKLAFRLNKDTGNWTLSPKQPNTDYVENVRLSRKLTFRNDGVISEIFIADIVSRVGTDYQKNMWCRKKTDHTIITASI